MGKSHPDNGPTFSQPTYKKGRPELAPSPERRKAELEETMRDCAKAREFNKDPAGWGRELARARKARKD
jgi:hypothetical protein